MTRLMWSAIAFAVISTIFWIDFWLTNEPYALIPAIAALLALIAHFWSSLKHLKRARLVVVALIIAAAVLAPTTTKAMQSPPPPVESTHHLDCGVAAGTLMLGTAGLFGYAASDSFFGLFAGVATEASLVGGVVDSCGGGSTANFWYDVFGLYSQGAW